MKKKTPQILEIYIQYLKRELDLLERVALQCAVLKRKQRSENPPPLLEKLKVFFLFLINIAMLPKNNTPFRQKKIFFGSPPIYEKMPELFLVVDALIKHTGSYLPTPVS